MVSPKRLSYGVFPSDKRSWMFRRCVNHSIESAHQLSSRPDCNNTADVPSFTLRTAKFQGIVCKDDFRLFRRLEKLSQTLFRLLRRFCRERAWRCRQIAWMCETSAWRISHQLSFRPDCSNTAEVPSFTLRTALAAIPLVSDLCGVDVQLFQERSSQALPNSKELSV